MAQGSGIVDVRDAVVPRLDDDVFGDVAGGSGVSGEDNIIPHDKRLIGLLLEVWERPVDPDLVEVAHGTVLREKITRELAELVATLVQLVTANVEPVVGEELRKLFVNLTSDFVRLVVEDVQLTWVGLDSSVLWPVVVAPPRIDASQHVLVYLFPARACMAWHVYFWNDTYASGSCIVDDALEGVFRINLVRRISILDHVWVGFQLHGP